VAKEMLHFYPLVTFKLEEKFQASCIPSFTSQMHYDLAFGQEANQV